jgi:hypothetical protein
MWRAQLLQASRRRWPGRGGSAGGGTITAGGKEGSGLGGGEGAEDIAGTGWTEVELGGELDCGIAGAGGEPGPEESESRRWP